MAILTDQDAPLEAVEALPLPPHSQAGDNDDGPQRNFATDVPFEEDFGEDEPKKPKKGLAATLIVCGVFIFLAFALAVFFISRGSPAAKETVVRDNSQKLGLSGNANGNSQTNFEEDFRDRYGNNNASLTGPSPTPLAGQQTLNTAAITAPPPTGNAGIYQPNTGSTGSDLSQPTPGSNAARVGTGRGEVVRAKPRPQAGDGDIDDTPDAQTDASVRYQTVAVSGRNEQRSLYYLERSTGSSEAIAIRPRSTGNFIPAPIKPTFGTVFPVRLLGRLHTLGENGLARLELTRAVQGSWGALPKGTLFVGRVAGGEANRVFVSLLGYIDTRAETLVPLGGDIQGVDGALGVQGEVKQLGSRWAKVFRESLNSAKDLGTAYLLGRRGGGGSLINNGTVERVLPADSGRESRSFVLVSAGASCYIVINDLPPEADTPRLAANPATPTNDEILRLLQATSPAEIESLLPTLSPAGQELARLALQK